MNHSFQLLRLNILVHREIHNAGRKNMRLRKLAGTDVLDKRVIQADDSEAFAIHLEI